MRAVRVVAHDPSDDERGVSGRVLWYCNEILKRTDVSGPISTIEFNCDGTHFAYGNGDGIVSVVEMGLAEESEVTHARHTCSKPYHSFLSHETEFDVLKSQEIDGRITIIRWLPKSAQSHFLLASNERTIKLWRLSDVPVQTFSNLNFPTERGCRRKLIIRSPSDIKVPKGSINTTFRVPRVWNKRNFDRAHNFCITGLSTSIDRETFLSTDALRINLWHLEISGEVFAIMDRPLDTVDDRTHLITGLDCSSVSPTIFAYCTNRGSVRVHDLRQNASCDHPSVVFSSTSPDEPNILTLFINAMSDVKMSRTSDRYIFSRDYLTVKVWDMNMPSVPVEVHPVQTQLRDHLGVLYESELLCDDFKLTVSSDDRFVASGSYNRSVKVFDRHTHENSEYSLVMQKEELSPFVDPFSAPVDPGLFAFSLADSAELPWPRRIAEEKDTGALGSLGFDYSSECGKFGIDVGCKWLQVSWRPGSYVFAVDDSPFLTRNFFVCRYCGFLLPRFYFIIFFLNRAQIFNCFSLYACAYLLFLLRCMGRTTALIRILPFHLTSLQISVIYEIQCKCDLSLFSSHSVDCRNSIA